MNITELVSLVIEWYCSSANIAYVFQYLSVYLGKRQINNLDAIRFVLGTVSMKLASTCLTNMW